MAIKKKEGERLEDEFIEKVIALYANADKPITIKEACGILNINPNGPRLNKIIAEYQDRKALHKKYRDANRGKPATDTEIQTVIEHYLIGTSIKEIGDMLHRSDAFVKRIVEEVGVPQKVAGDTYASYAAHPEQCIADSFDDKELVWVQKYGGIAQIKKNHGPTASSDGYDVYSLWVFEFFDPQSCTIDGKIYAHVPQSGVGGFNAAVPSYEIGSLRHLSKYNIDIMKAAKIASGV